MDIYLLKHCFLIKSKLGTKLFTINSNTLLFLFQCYFQMCCDYGSVMKHPSLCRANVFFSRKVQGYVLSKSQLINFKIAPAFEITFSQVQLIEMVISLQRHGKLNDRLTHLTMTDQLGQHYNQKACNPNRCKSVSKVMDSCQHNQCQGDSQEDCNCNRLVAHSWGLHSHSLCS